MLKAWEIYLTLPEGQRLHQSIGSVLHGALMEYAGSAFAEAAHRQGLRPYSQYAYYDKENERAVWRLAALNAEAAAELEAIFARLPENLYLKQKNYVVKLSKPLLAAQSSYAELAAGFFTRTEAPKRAELEFITSASFKAYGEYKIFPDNLYIFRSLLNRWNAFSAGVTLEEDGLEQHLADSVRVCAYRLSLQPYSVGGAPIAAFKGQYGLLFTGTPNEARIAALLLSYARFAGTGIKTALGMGGTSVKILP